MKRIVIFWLLACIVTLSAQAQSPAGFPERIAGTYRIYTTDKELQSDEFEITGGVKAVDILRVAETKGEQRLETAINKSEASKRFYQKSLNGVLELRTSVEKDYIWFYEGEAKVGALTIDPYLMFFDPIAYSAYTLLVRSYNETKGGSQTFPVIVPALQDYCEIEMQRHGSDAFTIAGKSVNAAHFRMTLGKKETINCWADGDRVIAIVLTVKALTIVDDSYPDLLKEVRRVTGKSL